jgi:hypothetical protein
LLICQFSSFSSACRAAEIYASLATFFLPLTWFFVAADFELLVRNIKHFC